MATTFTSDHRSDLDEHEDARQIRREIENTRHEMDETLDELGERLNFHYLMGSAMDYVKSTTARTTAQAGAKIRSAAGQVTEKIKQYPMSAAAIGVGLGSVSARKGGEGLLSAADQVNQKVRQHPLSSALLGAGLLCWVIERAREKQPHRARYGSYEVGRIRGQYADDYSELAVCPTDSTGSERSTVGEKVRDISHSVTDKLGDIGSSVRETTSRLGSRAAEGTSAVWQQATSGTHRMTQQAKELSGQATESIGRGYQASRDTLAYEIDEHPLAAAAAALGVGLLAGFLVPRTRTEDNLMGEAADALKDQAWDVAERGKEAVQATSEVAIEQLKHQAKDLAQDALDRGKEVAHATGQAAMHEAEQRGLGLKSSGEHQAAKSVDRETTHASGSDIAGGVRKVDMKEPQSPEDMTGCAVPQPSTSGGMHGSSAKAQHRPEQKRGTN